MTGIAGRPPILTEEEWLLARNGDNHYKETTYHELVW
jgi:hypothetical protein